MKSLYIVCLFTIFGSCCLQAQCPTADLLVFQTQHEIANFSGSHSDCIPLDVSVRIQNLLFLPWMESVVRLSAIQSIDGDLDIFGNFYLPELGGLQNLKSLSGHLTIAGNDNMKSSIESLIALYEVSDALTTALNDKQANMDSPPVLRLLSALVIQDEDGLQTVSGFYDLVKLDFGIRFFFNHTLRDISAFNVLKTINKTCAAGVGVFKAVEKRREDANNLLPPTAIYSRHLLL